MGARRRLVGGTVLTALAAAAGVLARPDLPAHVAIHFGPDGIPDDYVARDVALVFVPGLMLALVALFEVVPRVDPLGENVMAAAVAYDAIVLATHAFLAFVQGVVLAINLGVDVPVGLAVAVPVSALLVVVGYVLDRVDRNWTVGVRNPWTLSDDVVWDRTHARAAVAFKLAGVAGGALAFALPEYAIPIVVAIVVVVVLALSVYSYVLYSRRQADGDVTAP